MSDSTDTSSSSSAAAASPVVAVTEALAAASTSDATPTSTSSTSASSGGSNKLSVAIPPRDPSKSGLSPSPQPHSPSKPVVDNHRKQMAAWLKDSLGKHSLLMLVFIRGSWDAWCRHYCHAVAKLALPEAQKINAAIAVITPESTSGAAYLQNWLRQHHNVTADQLPVWSDPDLLFARKYNVSFVPIPRHKSAATTAAAPAAAGAGASEPAPSPLSVAKPDLEQLRWLYGPVIESQLAHVLETSPDEYLHGMTAPAVAFISERHDHLLQRWVSEPTSMNLHGSIDRPRPDNALLHVYDKMKGVETASVHAWEYLSPQQFKEWDSVGYSAVSALYSKSNPDYLEVLAERERAQKQEQEEREAAARAEAERVRALEAAAAEAARAAEQAAVAAKQDAADAEARLTQA